MSFCLAVRRPAPDGDPDLVKETHCVLHLDFCLIGSKHSIILVQLRSRSNITSDSPRAGITISRWLADVLGDVGVLLSLSRPNHLHCAYISQSITDIGRTAWNIPTYDRKTSRSIINPAFDVDVNSTPRRCTTQVGATRLLHTNLRA